MLNPALGAQMKLSHSGHPTFPLEQESSTRGHSTYTACSGGRARTSVRLCASRRSFQEMSQARDELLAEQASQNLGTSFRKNVYDSCACCRPAVIITFDPHYCNLCCSSLSGRRVDSRASENSKNGQPADFQGNIPVCPEQARLVVLRAMTEIEASLKLTSERHVRPAASCHRARSAPALQGRPGLNPFTGLLA